MHGSGNPWISARFCFHNPLSKRTRKAIGIGKGRRSQAFHRPASLAYDFGQIVW
jgi:hypothetical protein